MYLIMCQVDGAMAGTGGGVGGVDRRRAGPLAADASLGAALPLAVYLLVAVTGTYTKYNSHVTVARITYIMYTYH